MAWHGTKTDNGLSKYTKIIKNFLSPGQIAGFNSTRGSSQTSFRLNNPALSRPGGWIDQCSVYLIKETLKTRRLGLPDSNCIKDHTGGSALCGPLGFSISGRKPGNMKSNR